MKNRYRKNICAKVVENARTSSSVSPCRNLLFSRKDNLKFFEAALAVCSLQLRGWQRYEHVRLPALKHCYYHTGPLLAFSKTAIKIFKQGVKFVQTYQVYYNN